MTTFELVASLILTFLGLLAIATLAAIVVLALNILRNALQIVGQGKPLIARSKQLAATGKAIAGTAQHASREIKEEVNEVGGEVSRRTRGTLWLLRHVLLSPLVLAVAAMFGFRRAAVVWLAGRRLRRMIPRGMRSARSKTVKPASAPEIMPEKERLRKAA